MTDEYKPPKPLKLEIEVTDAEIKSAFEQQLRRAYVEGQLSERQHYERQHSADTAHIAKLLSVLMEAKEALEAAVSDDQPYLNKCWVAADKINEVLK